jgi:hypothetical protein
MTFTAPVLDAPAAEAPAWLACARIPGTQQPSHLPMCEPKIVTAGGIILNRPEHWS